MKLKDILKENPDTVSVRDVRLNYNDADAYAFGFHKGKVYVGEPGRTHFQIKKDLLDRGELSNRDYDDFPYTRREFKHTGRLWADDKVISFWEFPTEKQLKGIISKIEKSFGKRIWNNGWDIEVIDKGGKIYRPKRKGSDIDPGWSDYDFEGHIKLIPLEDYQGSQKQVGKELSHQKSPVLKKKKEVPMGIGSRKKVKGAKKGEIPAAARHRLRKGLGDGIIKLKTLLNEELFGEFGHYEVYKNPKSIKRMAKGLRGVSLPTGDLFVVDSYNVIHINIHKYLIKKGIKLPIMHTIHDALLGIRKGYINWQRDKLTNDFYLSESSPSRLDSETSKIFNKYVKKIKQKNPSYKFIEQSIWDRND